VGHLACIGRTLTVPSDAESKNREIEIDEEAVRDVVVVSGAIQALFALCVNKQRIGTARVSVDGRQTWVPTTSEWPLNALAVFPDEGNPGGRGRGHGGPATATRPSAGCTWGAPPVGVWAFHPVPAVQAQATSICLPGWPKQVR
jgi:hypothetical protein